MVGGAGTTGVGVGVTTTGGITGVGVGVTPGVVVATGSLVTGEIAGLTTVIALSFEDSADLAPVRVKAIV